MSSYTFKGVKVNHNNIDGATMAKVVVSVLKNSESKITQQEIQTIINSTQKKLINADQN